MFGYKQIAAIARRAAEIIQQRGKTKHMLIDNSGRVCTVGAIRMALAEEGIGWRYVGGDDFAVEPDRESREQAGLAEQVITEAFAKKVGIYGHGRSIPEWNDGYGDNGVDVIAKTFLQVADEIEVR